MTPIFYPVLFEFKALYKGG